MNDLTFNDLVKLVKFIQDNFAEDCLGGFDVNVNYNATEIELINKVLETKLWGGVE